MQLKPGKLYYSIGEVADMFEVNTSLIRFWEKEFALIKPGKNKKGNRLFTQKDIQNFEKIYQLVKVQGYTLEGAKLQLRKNGKSEAMVEPNEVIKMLENIKADLLRLKEDL